MLFLLAPQSKIQDIQERQQRNHKPNRHVIGPDISHQHWGKGSACYSHKDDAFIVEEPIPSRPSAKIVGNIMDMKKKER